MIVMNVRVSVVIMIDEAIATVRVRGVIVIGVRFLMAIVICVIIIVIVIQIIQVLGFLLLQSLELLPVLRQDSNCQVRILFNMLGLKNRPMLYKELDCFVSKFTVVVLPSQNENIAH